MRVLPGSTADPEAFKTAITAVKDDYQMDTAIMVGDRGVVTGARIDDLRGRGHLGWVGALDRPQIAALAADQGPLQMTLFDQADLFCLASPDYPGQTLIASRNPPAAKAAAARDADAIADAARIDGVHAKTASRRAPTANCSTTWR
ncbi:MAG: hypothetical protein LBG60_16740 [Bifidobacteriaceae bacterium]|nr:hypothetical protein [Bifidobacteriaceae bacterium]